VRTVQVCDEHFGLCISAVSLVTGVCVLLCTSVCFFERRVCVCTRAAVVCLPLDFTMAASGARALLSRTRIALAMREKQLLIFF